MAASGPSSTANEEQSDEKESNIDIDFSLVYRNINDDKEVQVTKQQALALCPTFDSKDSNQIPLWRILTVARLNKLPLLQLLYSCYMRDRLRCLLADQPGLEYQQWVKQSPTIASIVQSHRNKPYEARIRQDIATSISLFYTRRCGILHLPPLEFIDDDINAYAKHIIAALAFIRELIDGGLTYKQQLPPYQFDVWIMPSGTVQDTGDDDDDDDEDDDDEEEDAEQQNNDAHTAESAEIDIKQRLNDSKVKFVFNEEVWTEETMKRVFHRRFLRDKTNATDQWKTGNQVAPYPHGQRVAMIIDRRNKTKDDKDEEKKQQTGDAKIPFYVYQPTEFDKIPSAEELRSEWFIEAACSSLLPAQQNQHNAINAKDTLKGLLFVLSFQIEEKGIERCFLYHRSSIHRFFAEDILELLPRLFKEGKNKLNAEIVKEMKTNLDKLRLVDRTFDAIYRPIAVADK
mmetsp:Transcript_21012/g.33571  ORF Transcript_21012/g.33571 Transcript_21012/m.33571 type:complete len:458 (-) Transcript_21012:38-1411(-)